MVARGWLVVCGAFTCAIPLASSAQEIQLTGPLGETGPSYEPSRGDDLRLEGGALAPIVAIVPRPRPEVLTGGGARVAVSAPPFNDSLWLEGDFFTGYLTNDEGEALLMGVTGTARYHIGDALAVGVGFCAGAITERGSDLLRDGPFFGPMLTPLGVWLDIAHLELRVPWWFVRTDPQKSWLPGVVAPQILFSIGGRIAPPMAHFDGGRSTY